MKLLKTAALLLLIVLTSFKTYETKKNPKPNILWVLTDDQRYDAINAFNRILHNRENSALGYVESPQVDKLAQMGTTFINTYCQAQGCAPSRASMHNGRYPFRSGIYQFEYFNNNTDNSYPMLPEEMAKLGYQTFHVGKLGVRIKTLDKGKAKSYPIYQTDISFKLMDTDKLAEWGKVSVLKEIDGIKLKRPIRSVVYFKDASGKIYYKSEQLEKENPQFKGMAKTAYEKYGLFYKYNNQKNEPQTVFGKGVLAGESPQPAGKTRDANYTTAFIEYLKNKNKEFNIGSHAFKGVNPAQPLFAHIGYDFPHTPVLPPAEYRARFHKKNYKIPELSKEEFKKMAKAFQGRVKKSYSDDFTDEEKQLMVRDYYAFCAYGDDLIGKATQEFIEYSNNNKQPWMIVYVCGDHGWKLNEHGSIAKNTPWEIDSHNPIIVVSSDKKKFPKGKVVKDFTEFVDIAPTILNAGGADIHAKEFNHLDGFDLEKVASKKAITRDYVIGESHHAIGPRAYIRTKDYMFSVKTRPNSKRGVKMDWAMTASYKDLDPALYDTKKDPDELNNVAFDKNYRKIAEKMKDKLLSIVIGDGRAEVNWGGDNFGKTTKAIGTKVYRSNFSPGAHDHKLNLK
ncbi:sulfatase-like hydrolase/transferase [Flavicella sp.]|uniref:sulfatase-like hydrolase/transferase n=1 Tax=Flavicella sp. TaxID=2957742 RepID=UPI002609FDF2|nr:sulfatase-like hydrolase/transferase [Flavicella sp.]MDG1805472.1 sulfatase-like hydrolase/transferase [Flavicella sp.]MDG2281322.1 sulfatase-like hydrolase/transferase [Flavicella sp.]